MKLTLTLLLTCGIAHAQVIQCPPAYPLQPTALTDDNQAIVERSLLSGGGVSIGDLGGKGDMQGDRKRVKDGVDVQFGFRENEPKWFVCGYSRDGAIGSWRAISAKATSCTMRQRERGGVITVTALCK